MDIDLELGITLTTCLRLNSNLAINSAPPHLLAMVRCALTTTNGKMNKFLAHLPLVSSHVFDAPKASAASSSASRMGPCNTAAYKIMKEAFVRSVNAGHSVLVLFTEENKAAVR